jgi:glycerol-3-phosphate dehydrogenase (NAD(P)+)
MSERGQRIAVIGAGSWGTTVAALAARGAGPDDTTFVWAREPEVAASINDRRANERFLPGIELPSSLRATTELGVALDGAAAVIMAVPAQFFRPVFREVAPHLDPSGPVISVVKGIERGSLARMTEIMRDESDHDPGLIGVLAGPNLAREIAAGQPAATVIALPDGAWAQQIQSRLMGPMFRVYTNTDVVGCEISGAVKNVIAIAAGMADGLEFGTNTKAALLTRGLAELTRLGTALGGHPMTFLGLAGNGDLVATCTSVESRNHKVGVELGRGRSIDEIVNDMHMVAEGVETAPALLALAERAGVEMPITQEVNAIIRGERTPAEVVVALMGREPRAEVDPTRWGLDVSGQERQPSSSR